MAVDNKVSYNKEPVCHVNVAAIVTALHQKAEKEAEKIDNNCKIANSAVSENGNEITSAGEHIISVIPNEGKQIKKSVAIKVLKTYVQWFVGPDLAKTVDRSTVQPLDKAPGKTEGSPLKEHATRIMSFKHFLLEADGEPADPPPGETSSEETSSSSSGETSSGETSSGDTPHSAPEEDDRPGEEDAEDSSPVGYYIVFNLVVQGLPQVALKDAMKKFAKTFFDDVTFKAQGIFGGGGGDSFTVKDVKDSFKSVFGSIDPKDLESKIREQIEEISDPNGDRPEVKIRNRKTLISDLGGAINGKQKQAIDSCEYTVWISLTEFDPKKPIFNKRIIADIVTSSISGLWKKFKNKITADDVIFIENYADIHEDTKKLRELQNLVPTPEEIESFLERQTAAKVYKTIKDAIDKIRKHGQWQNSRLAQACSKVWEDFSEKIEKDENALKQFRSETLKGKALKDFYKPFTTAYEEAYRKFYDKQLDEAIEKLDNLLYGVDLKKLILEDIFGEADDEGSTESTEGSEDKEEKTVDLKEIADDAKQYIKQQDQPDAKNVFADTKKNVLKACRVLDIDAVKDEFTKKYGLVVDYTGSVQYNSSKENIIKLKESLLKDIFNIIDEKEKSSDKEGKSSTTETKSFDVNKLQRAMKEALTTAGIEDKDIGELIIVNKKKLDESHSFDDEYEMLEEKDSVVVQYIKNKGINRKEDALKDDVIQAIIDSYKGKKKPEPDKIRKMISDYFENPKKSSYKPSSPESVFGKSTDTENKACRNFAQQVTTQLRHIDKSKKISPSITAYVGPVDYVKGLLDKAQLYNDDIKKKAEEKNCKYVCVVPVQLPGKLSNGKDKQGTAIGVTFDSFKKIVKEKFTELKDKTNKKSNDFKIKNVFSYKSKTNTWNYYKSNEIPENCEVYVALLTDIPDPGPGPGPGPNPPTSDKDDHAYILQFDLDEKDPKPVESPDVDVDADVDDAQGRKDLYLIPMKDLRYNDKEYDAGATKYA